ncbi:MAG: helix-turn-helix domain containing protein [Hormoscilla sp. GM102CHS1]|nr:helix-turn-helix domain containing protein [Hormoscilla sp. GM102CHS1]
MPTPKPTPIVLSQLERDCLESLSRCTSKPYRLVQRARLILHAASGQSNTAIESQLNLGRSSVREWRNRWYQASQQWLCDQSASTVKQLLPELEAVLSDRPRPGSPSKFSVEQIVEIVAVACELPASSGRPISHWTPRELADEAVQRGLVEGISPHTAGRFLR